MTSALVLINTEAGSEENVLKILKNIDEIKEIYLTYGAYDIIAKIVVEDIGRLKEIVSEKIRKIREVKNTLTMIVVEGSFKKVEE
ncbi:MAG: Lrp/AsnC ligand binding domain-containing protein [Desulfurococcales archaeon]|jgi:DNA-binding Lrp family transcriptional regulator|nr:Lrp/AsnC ligand binding domain-containing protein [Desulfurococcales archaeon]MCI4456967.1 Lrp/AsnC ligand binding domain-containing protein [Desulfurococcaceae archaeon]